MGMTTVDGMPPEFGSFSDERLSVVIRHAPQRRALPVAARLGHGSKDEPIEVVMGPRSGPDFDREWAVLGSNQ
jgi:hypothetical protein